MVFHEIASRVTETISGYYYSGTDSYDINWTVPQCVLVLRLIGKKSARRRPHVNVVIYSDFVQLVRRQAISRAALRRKW